MATTILFAEEGANIIVKGLIRLARKQRKMSEADTYRPRSVSRAARCD
ncbi:hypothetical protein [uncultured Sphingomonas sp.]|nr:hypothetical protein [uncultured Sphingomonas sp.]